MVLPSAGTGLNEAQSHYPQIPIESRKAWTEMVHRYAAGTLALFIFFIGFSVIKKRLQGKKLPWHLPAVLLILVIFQAALGMWTVTLKLLPVVVMGHLLGGMLIFACLTCFRLQISSVTTKNLPQWRPWLRLWVIIVFVQIALGGWVSSNYAGIACIGFPKCNGIWLPSLHFAKGFNLFSAVGLNYQGGLLDNDVRITIQFIHRFGALITALYGFILALLILSKVRLASLRMAAKFVLVLILVQLILGVLNVMYLLPIEVAVAHNGVAALLLAAVFCMLHLAREEYYAY